MEGLDRDFANWQEAKAYLLNYRFGGLVHPDMHRDDFIFAKDDGSLWLFAIATDDAAPVTSEEEAEFANPELWGHGGWGYMQGREFALVNRGPTGFEGIEWFDELRETQDTSQIAGPGF